MMTCIPWKLSTLGLAIGLGCLSACTAPATQQSTNASAPIPVSEATVSSSSQPVSTESTPVTKTPVTKTPVTSATTTTAIPTKSKESQKSESSKFRRVNFAEGKTFKSLEGEVGRYAAIKYILGASKGQTLRAGVSGCGKVTLAVSYLDQADGPIPLKQLTMNEDQTNLKTTLTSTGDYIIQVQNGDYPSCKYSLSVDIK